MRITNKLCAQHIGWHFKKHWQVQGKRVPRDTGAIAELQRLGLDIQLKTPEEVLNPKVEPTIVDIVGAYPKPIAEDSTHPDWHAQPCRFYGDTNVLLGGLPQAQVLTNTIEINSFPQQIEEAIAKQQLPKAVDRNVQNAILGSHVLDAEQVKLPKVKLVDRPAFNLPREYGISHERRNRLLMNKLLLEIEKLAGRSVLVGRNFIDNVSFKTSLTKDNDVLAFTISADKLITATRALEAVKGKFEGSLPDLFPMKSTITMPKQHIYNNENFYPFRTATICSHPHTLFTYFNKHVVGNLHATDVTPTQFQSRTMIKAFAAAVARAKQLHGSAASGALPKPIVVQCVQTDGRTFHFGVFQLNTLDVNSNATVRNYWFHRPSVDLFAECGSKSGRHYLEGYNSEAFRILNAFYHNI